MRQRRIWFGLLAMIVTLFVLLGRLAWIQVIAAGDFSSRDVDLVAHSVAQRQQGIELDSGRGDFYDRNGVPITGAKVQALVVFPVKRDDAAGAASLARIGQIIGAEGQSWRDFYTSVTVPKLWSEPGTGLPIPLTAGQAQQIAKLAVPGVELMETVRRYPADAAAKHVIGFIGQNPQRIEDVFARQLQRGSLTLSSRIGAAGLEKTMEPYLQGAGATTVSLFTDGLSRPLSGLDIRLIQPDNPYYPLRVNTTLDLGIQRQVERAMADAGIKTGSAVVLDVSNADVLAMASLPDYDPLHVVPEQGNWSNRALKAIAPGSVFKTIVAAAALEEGVVRKGETFHCDGELGKYGFTCWLPGGHGDLTLEQAYAQSCNITFAKLMMRLSGSQLQDAAYRLGLDRQVGWETPHGKGSGLRQLDGEEKGQVFAGDKVSEDEGVRVQTAIGQRDVLVSPLQAANLVVTLLHGGEVLSPRIVRDVRYRTGVAVRSFPEQSLAGGVSGERFGGSPESNRNKQRSDTSLLGEQFRGVSAGTAKTLLGWMRDVVDSGTGQSLRQARWKLAGKSGTAQTTSGGKPAIHQWFVGYGPVDHPRYAVAVVAENEPENSASRAIVAFRRIMDQLSEQERHMTGGK
ncbi:MAG: penicillin-binding protein [Paenibacillus sp.]|jgi:cell division protein FtsI/penicillin-binding protein 2|nr:penicillin-binding protein [Paenibacillus sp.]